MLPHLALAFALTWGGVLVSAVTTGRPAVDLSVRNAPGVTSEQTIHAIRRGLAEAAIKGRQEEFGNQTTLDKSFSNAVLGAEFSKEVAVDLPKNQTATGNASTQASVEVLCRTCYIKGDAKVDLTFDGDFDAGVTLKSVGEGFKAIVDNITDYADSYISGVVDNIKEEGLSSDTFDLPPLDLDLNIDIQGVPEVQMHFAFDGLELYMDMQLTMSAGATYALNLYTSVTPLGFDVGDVFVGVVFAVDLLLSVESEISISSGFHMKLDDGVAIDIALFSDEVSDIVFNGGKFEFLPVTIESDGVILKAVLRVAIHSGMELHTPSFDWLSVGDLSVPSAGGGIEVGVYATLADLTTSVILAGDDDRRRDDDEDDCLLRVRQEYLFALGAAAGATVVFNDRTWGPAPQTEIAIFYTTLADECAISAPVATSTPSLEARQDDDAEGDDDDSLTTTTLEREAMFTALECLSVGVINCPPSLQSLRKVTEVQTYVTAVASGVEAVWPDVTALAVDNVVDFGNSVLGLDSTSGSPVSFVPPPPPPTETPTSGGQGGEDNDDEADSDGILSGKAGGVDKKVILGVSIGVGVPVLLAIIAGIILLVRRRRGGSGVSYQPNQSNVEYTAVDTGAKKGDIQQEIRSIR
ncbi:hypothetical protein ACHAQA_002368 [Verticillium albo-atrum]